MDRSREELIFTAAHDTYFSANPFAICVELKLQAYSESLPAEYETIGAVAVRGKAREESELLECLMVG